MTLIAALLTLVPPALAQDLAEGKAIYTANCMACHGTAGDGAGSAAIAMTPKPTNFTNAAWWTDRTDEALMKSIKAGSPGTSMTAFTKLSDADLTNLMAYLRTFEPAE